MINTFVPYSHYATHAELVAIYARSWIAFTAVQALGRLLLIRLFSMYYNKLVTGHTCYSTISTPSWLMAKTYTDYPNC